jgi:HPt (histidine-containing phosphotransfer) domain-containing protein
MSDTPPSQDLDLSFLYEIADGSDEFIVDSIGMFLDQTPQLLDSIENAINQGDWAAASSTAHKLKPNLGFFGMPLSQANIQDVEIECKNDAPDTELINTRFNQVKEVVSANLIALNKIKLEKEANL